MSGRLVQLIYLFEDTTSFLALIAFPFIVIDLCTRMNLFAAFSFFRYVNE